MLVRTLLCRAPPKVVVLSMTANGGALAAALRQLGFHPYTFEDTFRRGHIVHHPQEWIAVLRREKPFDPALLDGDRADANVDSRRSSSTGSRASSSTPPYDALVGPPATLAFEAVLAVCPRSTRVILVEEPDKLAWESEVKQVLQPAEQLARRLSRYHFDSKLHVLLQDMFDMQAALRHSLSGTSGASSSSGGNASSTSAVGVGGRRPAYPGAPLHIASGAKGGGAKPLGRLTSEDLQHTLVASLELFEARVKEVVPKDRLLVYRLGEGWGPLCQFLGVPVPTAVAGGLGESSPRRLATSESSNDKNLTAGTASKDRQVSRPMAEGDPEVEEAPFPPHSTGLEAFTELQHGLRKMQCVLIGAVTIAVLLALLALDRVRQAFVEFMRGYHRKFHDTVLPVVLERKNSSEGLSFRELMVMSKRATVQFGEEYKASGTAGSDLKSTVDLVVGKGSTDGAASAALTQPSTTTTTSA